jgi:hypothetical protein
VIIDAGYDFGMSRLDEETTQSTDKGRRVGENRPRSRDRVARVIS